VVGGKEKRSTGKGYMKRRQYVVRGEKSEKSG